MKKASTWYLVLLAILNLLLAQGTSGAAVMWTGAYRELGLKLPKITLLMLSFHWWPYIFVVLTIVLAFVSMGSRWPSEVFYHFIIMLLVVECFILFTSQIIFALPLISTLALR